MKYVKKAGYIVATIFFLVFTLGPFVWTFVMAITPKAEMFSNVVSLLRVILHGVIFRICFLADEEVLHTLQV